MNLVDIVKEAGIVGAGGAGFPTHVKLNTKADYFIVNAAECEPLIETDKFMCRTFPDALIKGIVSIATHLEAKKAVIAIKGKYKEEIKALEEAIIRNHVDIELFQMKTFYPAGDEQLIVQQVTGKTVPERGIPIEVGAVVNNVVTVLGIYDALFHQKSTIDKYLSVVGEVKEPIMLHVPIGTSIRECIDAALPVIEDYAIILGGPMMGKVFIEKEEIDALFVTKTTGNILVLPKNHYLIVRSLVSMDRIKHQARSACIQCRMCTDLCPRFQTGHRIKPHLVMRNIWRENNISDNAEFEAAFGDAINCCSCGICELFACPMGLSPRKVNDYMKNQLNTRNVKVAKTLHPVAKSTIELSRIPTDRLISRLNLGKYNGLHAHTCISLQPKEATILLSSHIGKPAIPIKEVGTVVEAGELIASAAEGLSANIHGSISGTIIEVTLDYIKIRGN